MAEVDAGAVAPEVPVAPASTDAPAPESTADQVETPEGETPEPVPEKTLTQSEVNKIVAKARAQAERNATKVARAQFEAEYLRKEVERLQPQKTAEASGEPQQKDFDSYDDWILARAEYRFEQKQKALQTQTQAETKAKSEQSELAAKAKYVHDTVVSKGRAEYEDFDEVTGGDGVVITEPMLAAATRLKAGAKVLYHLGQNPEESQRIGALHPIEQAWELRDIESKLTAAPAPTRTPPPIVPSGSKTTVDRDPSKMSDKEFADWRRRQIAQRGH